jgi:hypothetical protein
MLQHVSLAGHSDPYCQFKIYDSEGDIIYRNTTKTVKNNYSPQFHERFTISKVFEQNVSHILFELWDRNNVLRDEFLGKARLNVADISLTESKVHRLQLGPQKNGPSSAALSESKLVVATIPGTNIKPNNLLLSPSEIYNLSPVQMKAMFSNIDLDNNGKLSIKEISDYARKVYTENCHDLLTNGGMTQEEIDRDILRSRPYRAHHVDFVNAVSSMDTDGDGSINPKEFILKWNQTAKELFERPEACSIM